MTYVPPGWITTFSGRKFWPLSPSSADVAIEDIAHALSMKCRFTGHTRHFYSVAQHSVLVAQVHEEFGTPADRSPWRLLAALLHDATEAYLPDVARPIKADLPGFMEIEGRVDAAVFRHFAPSNVSAGMVWQEAWHHASIKEADTRVLRTEMRDLMPEGSLGVLTNVTPYPFTIQCLSPEDARTVFLQKFVQITEQLDEPRLAQFAWPRGYAGRLDLPPTDHAWLQRTLQRYASPLLRRLLPAEETEPAERVLDALERSKY